MDQRCTVQVDEQAPHYSGPERPDIEPDLRLHKGLLCPWQVDLHAPNLASAARGLDHALAHPAGERLPRHPVAARQRSMLL
jgi:hypothetical protein